MRQGLGRLAVSSIRGKAVALLNMQEQELLKADEFSLWLTPTSNRVNAGTLILGGRDERLWSGDLTRLRVIENSYAALSCLMMKLI